MENLKIEGIKTIFKIRKNEEKKGIELYFETIPNYKEREILKNRGFRWNNFKKCWYIKADKLKEEKKETKKATKKEIQRTHSLKVGDILEASWRI